MIFVNVTEPYCAQTRARCISELCYKFHDYDQVQDNPQVNLPSDHQQYWLWYKPAPPKDKGDTVISNENINSNTKIEHSEFSEESVMANDPVLNKVYAKLNKKKDPIACNGSENENNTVTAHTLDSKLFIKKDFMTTDGPANEENIMIG